MARFAKPLDYVPRGSVTLFDAFGDPVSYSGRTAAQRGTALLNAITKAKSRLTVSTDWSQAIVLAPGTFDLGSSVANLNFSSTVGISLRGAGGRATVIQSTASQTTGAVIVPGSSTVIAGLYVQG